MIKQTSTEHSLNKQSLDSTWKNKRLITNVLTVHPDIVRLYAGIGPMASGVRNGVFQLNVVNLRDHAVDQRGSVDDRPYGGGDGMVMRIEPLVSALEGLEKRGKVILPAPSGNLWTQDIANDFVGNSDADVGAESSLDPTVLTFVCGRFAGIDQRFIDDYVDYRFSLGDYIVSGGELAALAWIDSLVRLLPSALGHAESADNDSFSAGCDKMLEWSQYTRPEEFRNKRVPDTLMSGDHKAIEAWRRASSLENTRRFRPDLLASKSDDD